MKQLTCESLRKWLEKMPADATIRFALDGAGNTQETLKFVECFPNGRTYHIILQQDKLDKQPAKWAQRIAERLDIPAAREVAYARIIEAESPVGELVAALENFREWFANHFEDFAPEINAQLLCLDNEAEAALRKARS